MLLASETGTASVLDAEGNGVGVHRLCICSDVCDSLIKLLFPILAA
jgi:hypothetical protein